MLAKPCRSRRHHRPLRGSWPALPICSDCWGLMAVEELLRDVTVAVARSLEVVGDSVKVCETDTDHSEVRTSREG